MKQVLVRILGYGLAAFVFHLVSFQTSAGTFRFELPFFLAVLCAIREPRPWVAGLTILIPSIIFDLLDGHYSSTLSHLITFVLIRRLKYIVSFERFPLSLGLGCLMVVFDRILYGLLVGLKMGAMTDQAFRSVIDPAHFLTVIVIQLFLFRSHSR